jgi:hypothetical protein
MRDIRRPSGLGALGDSQRGAAGARIGGDFRIGRPDGTSDEAKRRLRQIPCAHRHAARQLVGARRFAQESLDQPVFERMEADDGKAPARLGVRGRLLAFDQDTSSSASS